MTVQVTDTRRLNDNDTHKVSFLTHCINTHLYSISKLVVKLFSNNRPEVERLRRRVCYHFNTYIPKGKRVGLPFLTCISSLEIELVVVHKQCCYTVCRLKWCRCCGHATISGKNTKCTKNYSYVLGVWNITICPVQNYLQSYLCVSTHDIHCYQFQKAKMKSERNELV